MFEVRMVFRRRTGTTMGRNVVVSQRPIASHLSVIGDGILNIGDDVHIAHGVSISAATLVEIEECVQIGPFVLIMDSDHHKTPGSHAVKRGSIFIGKGSRICAGSIILRGSYLGAGCWIEPGSVVMGHVSAGQRVTGNPAR